MQFSVKIEPEDTLALGNCFDKKRQSEREANFEALTLINDALQ